MGVLLKFKAFLAINGHSLHFSAKRRKKSFNPCATCTYSMGNENLDEHSQGSSSLFPAIAGNIVGVKFDPFKNFFPRHFSKVLFLSERSREKGYFLLAIRMACITKLNDRSFMQDSAFGSLIKSAIHSAIRSYLTTARVHSSV